MPYEPAAERYERMQYRRCGRSGLELPAISLGLWQNFGGDRPSDDSARDRPPRVRPRHHALRPREQLRAAATARPRRTSAASSAKDLAGLPRRARDLDQGRLRHVARTVRRVGLAQVPAREPRPESRSAWGSTTSTSSTRTASTRTRRSRRPWVRSTPPSARARRSTPASRRTRRTRRGRRRRSCAAWACRC